MKRNLLIAATTLILAATSCKKETTPVTPQNPIPKAEIKDVFGSNREAGTQYFTINASQFNTITGANGTKIHINANSLRTPSGAMVTGNVQVELLEALDMGDMLWYNTQTLGIDNGTRRILVSGGQYYLSITQGGQQLSFVPGGSWSEVPTTNPDFNMDLFFGTDSSGNITWNPADSSGVVVGQDSTGGSVYQFPNDSMGWVNCDYFYNPGGTQTIVDAVVPTGYNASNTTVWIVFPTINSVTGMYTFISPDTFTTSYYTLPVGLNVTFVALHYDGTNYYSAFSTTNIVTGHSEVLNFNPTTLSQFQTDVNSL